MIFLVDHGLQARYAMTPYFQDLPDTISLRREIPGIPKCRQTKSHPSCITFAYVPAPKDEYVPAKTYPSVDAFARAMASTVDAGDTLCRHNGLGFCDADACRQATFDAAHQCSRCCELHRVDRVVGTIMAKNGSRVGSGSSFPIAAENVLGFKSETALDAFLLRSPGLIQGAYIFSSPDRNRTTFLVQQRRSAASGARAPATSACAPSDSESVPPLAAVVLSGESPESVVSVVVSSARQSFGIASPVAV